jgi:hypothetical protein
MKAWCEYIDYRYEKYKETEGKRFLFTFPGLYLFNTQRYFEETASPTPMFKIGKHESNLFLQNRYF